MAAALPCEISVVRRREEPVARAAVARPHRGGRYGLPRRWLYIGLVVLATAALVKSTPLPVPFPHDYWRDLVILQLLFLICDSTPAPLVSRQTKWSPSSAATLAAVVLLGPVAAALVGAVSVISIKRQLRLDGRLFNGAMGALSGLLAGGPTSTCTATCTPGFYGLIRGPSSGHSRPRPPCTC